MTRFIELHYIGHLISVAVNKIVAVEDLPATEIWIDADHSIYVDESYEAVMAILEATH